MYWYKVLLGSRRYTTEHVEHVQASNTVEACNIAMRMHKGMRYAFAQRER